MSNHKSQHAATDRVAAVVTHPSASFRMDSASDAAITGALLGDLESDCDELLLSLQDDELAPLVKEQTASELYRTCSTVLASDLVLNNISESTQETETRWPGFAGRVQHAWKMLEDAAVELTSRLPQRAKRSSAPYWTYLGLAFTTVAALSVIVGSFTVAFFLILARVFASATLFTFPNVVSARSLVSCLTGHMADHLLVASVAIALMKNGHPILSLILAFTMSVAVFGTLARVAAERNGVCIRRSVLERIIRNSAALSSLAFVAFHIASLAPSLMIFSAGFGMYGIFEVIRVGAILYFEGCPQRSITVSVGRDGGVRSWASSRTTSAGGANASWHSAA